MGVGTRQAVHRGASLAQLGMCRPVSPIEDWNEIKGVGRTSTTERRRFRRIAAHSARGFDRTSPYTPANRNRTSVLCEERSGVIAQGLGAGLVRLVHLLAHLKTRAVLTAEQRRLYHEARWDG